jgi:ribonuclease VapC
VIRSVVLDSFALLAYLQNEAGAERVQQMLRLAENSEATVAMSLVNLGEVLYSVQRTLGLSGRDAALSVIDQLPILVTAPDRAQTLKAAELKAEHPIAYADCFAAALALAREAHLVTGDAEFRLIERDVAIEWIPR